MHRSPRRKRETAKRMKFGASIGEFANFSSIIHGSVVATCDSNPRTVQLAVIQALCGLNGSSRAYPISVSGRVGTFDGRVGFEIGVAEGIYFDYLDDETTKRLQEYLTQGKLYPVLDFLIVVTYSYRRGRKEVHLNFDHHQLRFIFYDKGLEMRLFHSKGIRRMPIDELFGRILDAINREMRRDSAEPLIIEKMRTL